MAWSDVIDLAERRIESVTSVALDITALRVREHFTTLGQIDTLVIATWNHGGAADPYEPHIDELDGLSILARPEDEDQWNINGHFPGEEHHAGCTCYWTTVTADMENVDLKQLISTSATGPLRGTITAKGGNDILGQLAPDSFLGPGADAGATPSPFSSAKAFQEYDGIDQIAAFDDFTRVEFNDILGGGGIWSDAVREAFERAV